MNCLNDLKDKIYASDCILIGIGEEFIINDNAEQIEKAYKHIAELLKGKNYYVVSLCDDTRIFDSGLIKDYIAMPLLQNVEEYDCEKAWDKYLKWFSCTLNRKLTVIELGVLMNKPQVIRWPFEKAVMINNKAELIRVNDVLPNIPAEISAKSTSIKCNAVDFVIGA